MNKWLKDLGFYEVNDDKFTKNRRFYQKPYVRPGVIIAQIANPFMQINQTIAFEAVTHWLTIVKQMNGRNIMYAACLWAGQNRAFVSDWITETQLKDKILNFENRLG